METTARHDFFVKSLKELGLFDKGSDYDRMIGRSIEELSKVFSKQGHTGRSAKITTEIFSKLMDEWNKTRGIKSEKPKRHRTIHCEPGSYNLDK